MRRAVLCLVVALSLLAGACEEKASADSRRTPQWPAGASGVACQLLDYQLVADQLGTRFDVAGGGKQDDTLTCALTQSAGPLPYLTLAMTPTAMDSVIFTEGVKPAGAYVVPDVGVIAYRRAVAPVDDAGPGVEVVWLSGTSRLMVLRYVFAVSATPAEVDTLMGKLLGLAQTVESTLPS